MRKLALPLSLVAVAVVGCRTKPVYLNRNVHTVAVLMPFNNSNYIEASEKMWPYVEHEVGRHGYQVVNRQQIVDFMIAKKFTADPGQINEFTCQQLAKEFGAEAVVYATIMGWGKTTVAIYTKMEVELHAILRDGKDGQNLWEGQGKAGDSRIGTSVADMVGDTLRAALTDLERFAGPAAQACFAKLPLAGYDPTAPPGVPPPAEPK